MGKRWTITPRRQLFWSIIENPANKHMEFNKNILVKENNVLVSAESFVLRAIHFP